ELPCFFQRATLFSSPSLFQEPFGLVNAEAMACATPVVGSDRGGIPEVLGNTGWLVDPENIEAFAAALTAALSEPARRTQLGRSALARYTENFDWRLIAKNWLALI